jgi:hypothetical protein
LSGCPSVTDSEVNKWRFFDKLLLLNDLGVHVWRGLIRRTTATQNTFVLRSVKG